MVALDEHFHQKDAKAQRRRRKEGFGRYNKSPTASVNSVACNYYLLQDLLYRGVALTNSVGYIVEAYDTDAYGNTLIFIEPGSDGRWFTDDDVQSSYGANEIIYCGYRYDPATALYYVRNRTYNPVLGRWLQRDPIGILGGINLYGYVGGMPVGLSDPIGMAAGGAPTSASWQPGTTIGGETYWYSTGTGQISWTGPGGYVSSLTGQAQAWALQGDNYASQMMNAFANQQFPGGNSGLAFEGIAGKIIRNSKYRSAAQSYFQDKADSYGKPGIFLLPAKIPLGKQAFTADLRPTGFPASYGLNDLFGSPHLSDLGIALGVAHFGYPFAVLYIHGCPGHLKWNVFALMEERNRYHFYHSLLFDLDPPYDAGDQLPHSFGYKPFYQRAFWPDAFSGKVRGPGAGGSGWGNVSWVIP